MPPPAAPPPRIGRYRIEKSLGAGGMGAVYLAEDTMLRRKVAVKVPHAADATAAVLERFLREARTAASIEHPNLCPVLDAGEANGTHYLVMPFIEGKPLSLMAGEGRPWEPGRATALVRKMALALQALHDRGIIHRDLKPANVMIRPDGEPVVMDFGLARPITNQTRQLTQTGVTIGTPAYMPPEQVLGDRRAMGPATDVYALGVLLFHLLTGRLPFEGPPAAVFGQILHTHAPPPSAFRPDTPGWLDAVCRKTMAKKPGDRFASMADLAGVLVPPQPTEPVAVPVATPAPPERVISCGGCGTKLKLPGSPGAGRVLCPRCRADLTAPASPPAAEAFPATVAPDLTRPLPPAGKARRVRALYLAASAVLAVVGFCVWRAIQSGDDPQAKDNRPPASLAGDFTNSIGMQFVLIPAGKFMMGSPNGEAGRFDDEVQHEVEIPRPFYMGVHEVTQEQYERIVGINPSYFSARGGGSEKVVGMETLRFPVESVSWTEAVEFCRRLSDLREEKDRQRTYRLPTEDEWEYSCRGGNHSSAFAFGNSLSSVQANFDGNFPYGSADKGQYLERTASVGFYTANRFGLYDMHGNVYEWCSDWYDSYDKKKNKDTNRPQSGARRVMRGGSWYNSSAYCRSANRDFGDPGARNSHGFRVVCEAVPNR
jgi:formylglycine-generating enzyme required for sulfatase activity